MTFKNFRIWRGKLPHWRADDVVYYVSFRHSRSLNDLERRVLFAQLLRPDARKYALLVVCVLPERTELLFRMVDSGDGAVELSDVVEKSKAKAGKLIVKRTGERFPPFYAESYDRIVRDEVELEERILAIIESPEKDELCEDASSYETLYVAPAD